MLNARFVLRQVCISFHSLATKYVRQIDTAPDDDFDACTGATTGKSKRNISFYLEKTSRNTEKYVLCAYRVSKCVNQAGPNSFMMHI